MSKTFSLVVFVFVTFAIGCSSPTKTGAGRGLAGESCQSVVKRATPGLLKSAPGSLKNWSLVGLRALDSGSRIPGFPKSHMEPYDNNPHRGYYLVVDIENIMTKERNRVKAPEKWRRKHIERHNRIWALSRQAINGKNVEANVTEIMKYLDEDYDQDARAVVLELGENPGKVKSDEGGSFYDVVERALGEVGSPLAARKLMHGITRDITIQKSIPFEKRVKHHFWATEALGSLNYSKDEALREEVETFLIDLTKQFYSAEHILSYNGLDALAQPAFNTPRVREFISQLAEQGNVPDWDIWRVLTNWNDPAAVPIVLKRLQDPKMQEISFSHGVTLLGQYKTRFKDAGLTQEEVFTKVIDAWENRESQWLNTFGAAAIAALAPDHCLPGSI